MAALKATVEKPIAIPITVKKEVAVNREAVDIPQVP